ncbi:hypothetical protein PAPYR_2852 [Paratrimastix pyriformis]|uniref:Jupiter microtubule associated homolog 1b n=1 Tax=Paratrimastix pyriformis TaxID=342808 RepID=A0ABQ8UPA5_9EUKA|nr:hypothetical protein PAPYR_2852 [Paratrimastix pyriformis]
MLLPSSSLSEMNTGVNNHNVDRPSIQIRAPPGGGCHDIFGTGAAEPEPAPRRGRAQIPPPQRQEAEDRFNRFDRNPAPGAAQAQPAPRREEAPAPAAAAPHSEAALFCTEGSQIRTGRSVKVSNPPGGRSSGLW